MVQGCYSHACGWHLHSSKLPGRLLQPPSTTHPLRAPPQTCTEEPGAVYGSILQEKMSDSENSQAVGHIVYTAQAILQKAANQVCVCWEEGR